jgi:hypothetical protein
MKAGFAVGRGLTAVILTSLLVASFSLPGGVQIAHAVPTLRYVAPGGSCGGATPCYAGVQAAVDAAAAGDEIRVAAGTYTGVNAYGGKSQHLYINKNLTINGGYTTSDWTTSDPVANVTELQAQTLGRVVFVAQGVTVTLDGFHLTYGNATGLGGHTALYTQDAGSAVYVYNATLTIADCQILHSSLPKEGVGGGLYARETVLTIDNTRFEDNVSGNGGAAYLYLSDSNIQNSQFVANQMSGIQIGNFAISVDNGTLTFIGNTLDGNFTPSGAGSAIGVGKANFTITGNQILGTASGSKNEGGVGLSYSTGTFSENYVANHKDVGVSVNGGFVVMDDNEIAYNKGITANSGGGVAFTYNSLYASQLTMTDNFIHHNNDGYSGGGGGVNIRARADNPVYLYNNIIQDNTAGDGSVFADYGSGGGIYISGGDWVTLVGNLIQRNVAYGQISTYQYGGNGGGVYIYGGAKLINNFITDNGAEFAGSGVFVSGSTPYLYHNTIANNIYAGGDGSGVYSTESGSGAPGQPRLYNNIISNQTVGVYADKQDVTSLAFVENVLWYGNGSDTGGPGTVFVNNPHTGDPLYADAAGGDYHINNGSAAIDIGTNANIPTGLTTDLDGQPRIANGTVDLGADEYDGLYLLTVTKSGGGSGGVTSTPVGIDCGGDCSQSFDKDTPVTLTATPDGGSFFAGWSGDADCADGQVTLNADLTCVATFIVPVTLTVTKAGDGSGTVTSAPLGIDCGADCTEVFDYGTAVTLSAVASAGSAFTGWSGDADCADGSLSMLVDTACTATFRLTTRKTYLSVGTYDGWILESGENTTQGGTLDSTSTTFNLGDGAADKQYRAILSFNTATLPDNAVITRVILKIRKYSLVGTDPFTLLGGLKVDMRKPYFGTTLALLASDFQAAAGKSAVATFGATPVSNWYSATLNAAGRNYLNKTGTTQFRLYFAIGDNDDNGADYMKFYSGNDARTSVRPTLIIDYYLP